MDSEERNVEKGSERERERERAATMEKRPGKYRG